MSNPHNLPDYKEHYFETKALDHIHGKPTLQQIIKVFRQLKRNATSVPTRLGGGNHGYLALVLTPTKYNAITTTQAFIRPTDPGVFTPTNVSTTTGQSGATTRAAGTAATVVTTRAPNSAEVAQQKATHDESL